MKMSRKEFILIYDKVKDEYKFYKDLQNGFCIEVDPYERNMFIGSPVKINEILKKREVK